MPKRYLALMVGAFVLVPHWEPARAQMDFSLDETESGTEGEAEPIPDDEPIEGSEDGEGAPGGTGGSLSDWGAPPPADTAATPDTTATAEGAEDAEERPAGAVEEIYAVQQIYALRLNRLELAPSAAFVVNDPYFSHPAVGVAANYWFSNVLAVGVNFLWYQFLDSRESELTFHLRRSTRLAVPITEWQMGLHLNFTYVPFYGKFNMFREFIFQYDAYVVGGVGLMRTRPVPIIDVALRDFDYEFRVAFNLGVGIRIFLTRYLALFTEFRNYMYLERFENLDVALGADRNDPDTWVADSNTFTSAATVQIGLTVFFPFSVEYRLPK